MPLTLDPLAIWTVEQFFTRGVWFDTTTCATCIDGDVFDEAVCVWIEAGDLDAILEHVPGCLDNYESIWVGYDTDPLTTWLIDEFADKGFWFNARTRAAHFDGDIFDDSVCVWIEAGDLAGILELVADPVRNATAS